MRAAALVVLGALALAGCGGGNGGGSSSAPAQRSGSAPGTTRTAAAPLPGAHRAPRERVPILMYHVMNAPPPGTSQPQLWVSRPDFEAQTRWLADRGYHGVTLQQVWDAWHRGGELPSKPIVFSFDDGYHSQLSNALPVLRSHGWPGVLNLQVNQTRQDLKPDDVRRLIRAGWEVDAHTYTHPDLTTVDAAGLRREIAGARAELRRTYGVPVNFFCYPAGRFDARVVDAVRAAGFLGATTTEAGLAGPGQSPFELRRIRINGSDGVRGLAASLGAAEAAA